MAKQAGLGRLPGALSTMARFWSAESVPPRWQPRFAAAANADSGDGSLGHWQGLAAALPCWLRIGYGQVGPTVWAQAVRRCAAARPPRRRGIRPGRACGDRAKPRNPRRPTHPFEQGAHAFAITKSPPPRCLKMPSQKLSQKRLNFDLRSSSAPYTNSPVNGRLGWCRRQG